jgi:hypothetical protein
MCVTYNDQIKVINISDPSDIVKCFSVLKRDRLLFGLFQITLKAFKLGKPGILQVELVARHLFLKRTQAPKFIIYCSGH